MSAQARQQWQADYVSFCSQHMLMGNGAAASVPATPVKQSACDEPQSSPKSAEKLVRRVEAPRPKEAMQPQFLEFVADEAAFHERWAFLLRGIKENATSSFFLKHSDDFFRMYADVAHLLPLGHFNGSMARAERALADYRLNRKKLSKVCEEIKGKETAPVEVPRSCVPGRVGHCPTVARTVLAHSRAGVAWGHVNVCAYMSYSGFLS